MLELKLDAGQIDQFPFNLVFFPTNQRYELRPVTRLSG
jgi:hypothetical protein